MSFESDESIKIRIDKHTQTHFFGEVPHQFRKNYTPEKQTTSLKKQRLAENIDPRFKYYSHLNDSESELMSNNEIKINNFLKKSMSLFLI